MNYFEKLKDPRWQRVRLQVFERDGWKCLACGDTASPLHVHHLQYTGEPWEAPLDALETLCESCHGWRERFKETLSAFRTAPSHRVIQIEKAIARLIELDPSVKLADLWTEALRTRIKELEGDELP